MAERQPRAYTEPVEANAQYQESTTFDYEDLYRRSTAPAPAPPLPPAMWEQLQQGQLQQGQFQQGQLQPQQARSDLSGPSGSYTPQSFADEKAHDSEKAQAHGEMDMYDPNRPKLPLKQRMHHFTWAWFTLTMTTGGLSLLFYAQPHQVPAFRQIGLVVYIANVIMFAILIGALVSRFVLYPGDLKASITHPREGFFVPTFFLSCATLITSTYRYAMPPNDLALNGAIQAVFWGYVVVTLFVAVGQYSYVFATHRFGLQTMMPTWILPIFPIMLSGTIASVIADTQPDIMAVPIVIGGLACQGLGIAVSMMMYAHMVGRLMQAGLPNREHRPGLFMNVGPPAFTALALIGMANGIPDNFDAGTGMAGVLDAAVIRTMAVVGAVFLWGLSLWWFGIATIAVLLSRPRYFHLGWWAMVFPNTGFALATISLGNAFKSEPVLYVANAMSVGILCIYLTVLINLIRAVIKQDIMYPGRDEDVEDH